MVFVYANHEGDFQGCDTNGIKPSFRYQYKYKSVTPKTVYFELEKCLSVNNSLFRVSRARIQNKTRDQ